MYIGKCIGHLLHLFCSRLPTPSPTPSPRQLLLFLLSVQFCLFMSFMNTLHKMWSHTAQKGLAELHRNSSTGLHSHQIPQVQGSAGPPNFESAGYKLEIDTDSVVRSFVRAVCRTLKSAIFLEPVKERDAVGKVEGLHMFPFFSRQFVLMYDNAHGVSLTLGAHCSFNIQSFKLKLHYVGMID